METIQTCNWWKLPWTLVGLFWLLLNILVPVTSDSCTDDISTSWLAIYPLSNSTSTTFIVMGNFKSKFDLNRESDSFKMLNEITIIVSKMTSTGTIQMREVSESGIRKWEEMWFETTADDGERAPAPAIAVGSECCGATGYRYAKIWAHHASVAVTALAAC